MKALILAAALVAALPLPTLAAEPIGYAPILLLYGNGEFLGVKEFAGPTATKAECMEEAQREVLKILEGAPEGATAIGGCLPIPPVKGSKPIGPKEKVAKPLTEPDGRQII